MRFNELKPAAGAHRLRKRVGRGAGSGSGKTASRGQKGQKSRGSGKVARGFEGGQMPLHRRLPKFGFASRQARFSDEVRLGDLGAMDAAPIDLAAVKAAGLVSRRCRRVKVIATGTIEKALQIKGLSVTRGARAAIEAAGGSVEE